jgi:hypothetical protein
LLPLEACDAYTGRKSFQLLQTQTWRLLKQKLYTRLKRKVSSAQRA